MEARVVAKNIEIEGRKFVVKKYTAMDGLKVAKLILAKVIPIFQDFVPLVTKISSRKPTVALNKTGQTVPQRQLGGALRCYPKLSATYHLIR